MRGWVHVASGRERGGGGGLPGAHDVNAYLVLTVGFTELFIRIITFNPRCHSVRQVAFLLPFYRWETRLREV